VTNLYCVVGQGRIVNGTATIAGSPVRLVPGLNTITTSVAGTATVYMSSNTSAVATSGAGGDVVTSSPKTCPQAFATSITFTHAGTHQFTITVTVSGTPAVFGSAYSWAQTSGAVPGYHAPSSSYDLILDSLSFTATGQGISANSNGAGASLTGTNVTNNPKLSVSSGKTLAITNAFTPGPLTVSWAGTLTYGSVDFTGSTLDIQQDTVTLSGNNTIGTLMPNGHTIYITGSNTITTWDGYADAIFTDGTTQTIGTVINYTGGGSMNGTGTAGYTLHCANPVELQNVTLNHAQLTPANTWFVGPGCVIGPGCNLILPYHSNQAVMDINRTWGNTVV